MKMQQVTNRKINTQSGLFFTKGNPPLNITFNINKPLSQTHNTIYIVHAQ